MKRNISFILYSHLYFGIQLDGEIIIFFNSIIFLIPISNNWWNNFRIRINLIFINKIKYLIKFGFNILIKVIEFEFSKLMNLISLNIPLLTRTLLYPIQDAIQEVAKKGK